MDLLRQWTIEVEIEKIHKKKLKRVLTKGVMHIKPCLAKLHILRKKLIKTIVVGHYVSNTLRACLARYTR
jgi:hypothetical protein